MKRKHDNAPASGRKKQHTSLKELESVHDQAKQYRLATVKFPIDALTPEWRMGTNRPIDDGHKRRLCQIFKEAGVLRRDVSHRLQVACTKAQVQQMLDHLKQKSSQAKGAVGASHNAPDADVEFPSFEDWSSVVGEKAELMAGNHRVEALKEYLRCSKSSQAERWWVCDIYDRDALPPHLHIKLRANREDTILPDNHGQIWTELATLSSNHSKLFQDSNKVVEQQMLEHLGLSSRVKFPVRRLATLWKNERWNPMITRWCQFSIGQSTFTISTFEWMASCRIDDYWFAAFDQVIQAASNIRGQFGFDIQLPDWNRLASLPAMHTHKDVHSLFYPSLELEAMSEPSSVRPRDFLTVMGDDVYYDLYTFLVSEPTFCFFDIQALLKITKQEGKLMSTLISHVSQWMNREPTKVADRDNNKPPLRKDLLPGLHKKYGEEAEEKSIALQQQLLDYIRCHTKDFTSATMDHYLHEYLDTHKDKYAARFEHAGWQGLLSLVLDFAGPNLQHPCMVRFNHEDLCSITSTPTSTVAQTARDLICQIPEFAQNPALQSTSASENLCERLELVVAQWVSEQCAEALECYDEEWPVSTVELVEAARGKFKLLLEELGPSLPPPPNQQIRQHGGTRKGEDVEKRLQVTHAHGSTKKHGSIKTKQHGALISTSTVPPSIVHLTADGLHDLRTIHRDQHTTRQPVTSPRLDVTQPKDDRDTKGDKQPRVHTIRGSKHWRQKAAVTHSSKS